MHHSSQQQWFSAPDHLVSTQLPCHCLYEAQGAVPARAGLSRGAKPKVSGGARRPSCCQSSVQKRDMSSAVQQSWRITFLPLLCHYRWSFGRCIPWITHPTNTGNILGGSSSRRDHLLGAMFVGAEGILFEGNPREKKRGGPTIGDKHKRYLTNLKLEPSQQNTSSGRRRNSLL